MSPSAPRLQIVVDQGPSAGATLILREGTVTIGRDPKVDLSLSGDETVSKRHVEIVSSGGDARLRNLSPNGTIVNGRPVIDVVLTPGDSISIGQAHLLRVQVHVPPPAPKPPTRSMPAGTDMTIAGWSPASATPAAAPVAPAPAGVSIIRRLPLWLVVYLVVIAVAFVGLAIMRVQDPGPPSVADIRASEQQYAVMRKLPQAGTDRMLRMLETATVHERRGDGRSAYEAYREVLGSRHPVTADSPAYRYAASRIAALGPK